MNTVGTNIQTKMVIIIGTNGTGKTTLAQKLINSIDVPRKLVITQHIEEWQRYPQNLILSPESLKFKGINWHMMIDPKAVFPRLKHFTNGMLVLDDARMYMTAQTDKDALALYISRRQNAIHLILIGHGFTQIPPQAFTFCTDVFLFATRDNIDSTRKNTVQDFQQLVQIQQRVNQRANDGKKCWVTNSITDNWHYHEHIHYGRIQ